MRDWRARRHTLAGLIRAAARLELEQQLTLRSELDALIQNGFIHRAGG